jgi:hypothetical protein
VQLLLSLRAVCAGLRSAPLAPAVTACFCGQDCADGSVLYGAVRCGAVWSSAAALYLATCLLARWARRDLFPSPAEAGHGGQVLLELEGLG